MNLFQSSFRPPAWLLAFAVSAFVAGCGSDSEDAAAPPNTTPTVDTVAPTVTSTNAADAAVGVCVNRTVNATFSEAMNAATIGTASFAVADAGAAPVTGSVSYAAASKIATFTPAANLADNTVYTATISGGASGAKDVAGNALAVNKIWTFTTGTCQATLPVALGAAASFGAGSGAGVTNQGTSTIVVGDLGGPVASTLMTGFHDSTGTVYTETPLNIGTVTGTIFTADAPAADGGATASQVGNDLNAAYTALTAMPAGSDPGAGELGGLTLPSGVYTAAGGAFQITLSDLTLDAQGDPNAVWVFQMASALTVGDTAARSVRLTNGAQAKNVFWQVGSAATVNGAGGGTMVGTIIAPAGVTFSTAGNAAITTMDGRAFGFPGSVTMVNTVITVPAP
ncbi:MAG: ice-binding family protein [Betaproteobacteria bacterium]